MPGKVDRASQTAAIAKAVGAAVHITALRGHLETILASPAFKGSRRSQEFLRYIVENALKGNFHSLKERNLGIELFARDASYDTGDDAIVRVTASDVRRRLHQYYLETVDDSGFRIRLPSGTYIPEFETGDAAPAPSPADSTNLEAVPEAMVEARPAAASKRRGRSILIAAALFVLGSVAGLLAGKSGLFKSGAAVLPEYSFYRDLLGPIATDPQARTEIVFSNPPVMVYWGANRPEAAHQGTSRAFAVPPGLEEQLVRSPEHATQDGYPYYFLGFASRDYTGMGEAVAAFHVAQIMRTLNCPVKLSQSRFLNWSNARVEHLILLGAPRISLWTQRNVQNANFTLTKNGILNAAPLRGERSVYSIQTSPETGEIREDYGLIWMSSSPSGTRVLVLAGLSSTGTAGVGDFFGDPRRMRPVYEKLRAAAKSGELPPNWQVLLKITSRENVPVGVTYVAHRIG